MDEHEWKLHKSLQLLAKRITNQSARISVRPNEQAYTLQCTVVVDTKTSIFLHKVPLISNPCVLISIQEKLNRNHSCVITKKYKLHCTWGLTILVKGSPKVASILRILAYAASEVFALSVSPNASCSLRSQSAQDRNEQKYSHNKHNPQPSTNINPATKLLRDQRLPLLRHTWSRPRRWEEVEKEPTETLHTQETYLDR